MAENKDLFEAANTHSFEEYSKFDNEEKKKEFDLKYQNEFKKDIEYFISTLDNDLSKSLKDKIISLDEEAKKGGLYSDSLSNIINKDDLIELLTFAKLDENQLKIFEEKTKEDGTKEKILIDNMSPTFIGKIENALLYFQDKEYFLKRQDVYDFLSEEISKLKEIDSNNQLKTFSKTFGLISENISDVAIYLDEFKRLKNLQDDAENSLKNKSLEYAQIQINFLASLQEEEKKELGIELSEENHTNLTLDDYKRMGKIEQNTILKRLMSFMPDFSQNLFTLGFFNTENKFLNLSDFALKYLRTLDDENKEGAEFNHINNNIDGFYVRVSSFDIPMPKSHTIEYKFFTRTISKVTSGIERPHIISITFDADQNGYIINHFQRMAGQFNAFPDNSEKRNLSLTSLQRVFNPAGYVNRNQTLNIFVKFNDVIGKDQFTGRIYNNGNTYNRYDISNGTSKSFSEKNGYNGFFLEDVQFLGFENSIDFNRDSAENIQMTAKFRFNQIYRIIS